ncbi:hypothetical protein GUJ93_ZPchr0006g44531 [Zizania palustris]|uniref:Uncharacterized protein n=1 Tax=Zizania palustris TaxID=103762 RepID=A0A8J5W2N7_ZIZPA|nr:hypothetical protein GUJ93_ZPchr0006g44531 [Zizania palustris]
MGEPFQRRKAEIGMAPASSFGRTSVRSPRGVAAVKARVVAEQGEQPWPLTLHGQIRASETRRDSIYLDQQLNKYGGNKITRAISRTPLIYLEQTQELVRCHGGRGSLDRGAGKKRRASAWAWPRQK